MNDFASNRSPRISVRSCLFTLTSSLMCTVENSVVDGSFVANAAEHTFVAARFLSEILSRSKGLVKEQYSAIPEAQRSGSFVVEFDGTNSTQLSPFLGSPLWEDTGRQDPLNLQPSPGMVMESPYGFEVDSPPKHWLWLDIRYQCGQYMARVAVRCALEHVSSIVA